LAGNEVKAGQAAPSFTVHFFKDGMQKLTLADVKGKPTLLSVVPSLDTPVCALQTKKFNESLGALGDKINAITVSLDLPFAMNRFCGAENITNMRVASDYQDRSFGNNWGTLIEEIKIMCRAIFVLDKNGKVVYAQYVPEVVDEPNYDAALNALKSQL
jgi:thiol peroxidase